MQAWRAEKPAFPVLVLRPPVRSLIYGDVAIDFKRVSPVSSLTPAMLQGATSWSNTLQRRQGRSRWWPSDGFSKATMRHACLAYVVARGNNIVLLYSEYVAGVDGQAVGLVSVATTMI
ncbi:unnamed protein product [Urochloa humidicola]